MPLTGSSLLLIQHTGPDNPDDPNLYSVDEMMAYMVPSSTASTVTSQVVSRAASGALDSVPVSTADSKAVSAGSRASVADSKAISGSINTSVADSKAGSVSVNTSKADSKATSVATATVTPTVGGLPGFMQSGVGAVIRTANAKMADWVCVDDYGAIGDGITDDGAAIALTITAAGTYGRVLFRAGKTYNHSTTLAPLTGQVWDMQGARLVYTGAGTAVSVLVSSCRLVEPNLSRSGAVGTSVGLAVGANGTSAHNTIVTGGIITGFYDNVVLQYSFYCKFFGTDCFAATNRNWYVTNLANSNDFFGVGGRGNVGVSQYGTQVDDTTNNSSNNRWFGGTFEGNLLENFEIRGADRCLLSGPHLERIHATSLTGTLSYTNSSTAVTGAGTAFLTEVVAGQYVKANAHATTCWARVESVTDNTNLVLSEAYNGSTLGGAASEVAGGNLRITSGSGIAYRNHYLDPENATESGTAQIGIYVQNAYYTRITAADIECPIVLGANAVYTTINANVPTGGLLDNGSYTACFSDAANSRYYIRAGTRKAFDLTTGGVVTKIKTGGNALELPDDSRGTFTISGVDTTATVTIPNIDTAYYPVISPTTRSASPAAGSNRVRDVALSAGSFTVTIEAAPGVGQTQAFAWFMTR